MLDSNHRDQNSLTMTIVNQYKKAVKGLILGAMALGTTLLFSCSKVNDQEPYTTLPPDAAFSNPERIEKSAIGMYDALQNAEFLGGRVLIYSDVRGNDVNPASYFTQVPTFNMLSTINYAFNCWAGGYRTIFEANLFTNSLQANESVIGAEAAAVYYGEAKFLRSLAYFYLVNTYGHTYTYQPDAGQLGVPLVLQPDGVDALDPKNKVPRSTVKQVYDQMISDLNDAAAVLPEAWGDGFYDHARATKGAAHALLSRIYLYMGDWARARDYADSVLLSPVGYELDATPQAVFSAGNYTSSSERIFSVAMNAADNPNTNNAIGQHYGANGRGDITISGAYLALPGFDTANDRRRTQLIQTVGSGSNATFYTRKFFGTSTFDSWVPIFRLAEIKLIKAEALARLSTGAASPEAITLVNEIRARANATAIAPATQAALIDAILVERRIELAFEGHGEFDFLRTHREIPARLPAHPAQAWDDDYSIFPIPFQEIQRNTTLIQNDGY
jgi:hypothetical protein